MSGNSNTSTVLRVVVLLLTVFGVPSATALAFRDQVTQNPGLVVVLVLAYEAAVLVLAFGSKVWQKLEGRWVDRVADWVDARALELFARYRKHYLEHLVYQHRDFDVKGLSTQGIYTLELEKVFVELRMAPRPAHEVKTTPIPAVLEELHKGQHVIWEYLGADRVAGHHLAVIGAPGCGKTTLLKHMTLTLAGDGKQRREAHAPEKLPILLFLRDHAKVITEGKEGKEAQRLSLAQAVRDNLTKMGGPATPAKWFEKQLEQGRCLVLLDGLDEVADLKARKQVAEWVEAQMVAYGKNRFVVTSRPHGYHSNPLRGVTVLEVQPFNQKQIELFVHNWYLANEVMSHQKDDPGVRMVAQKGVEDLLKRVRSTPALSDMTVNPLLLTMIATVHRYRSSLPGRRVELYAEICEVFLGKRQEARGLEQDLTPSQKQRVLQPLAYHLMCWETREVPVDEASTIIAEPLAQVRAQSAGTDFLKMVENTSGLLVERENGIYSFAHQTFQEYLAAVHVLGSTPLNRGVR